MFVPAPGPGRGHHRRFTLRRIARSVTELLPRPFAELTLDDVAQIIASIGEERETLFFERKLSVSGDGLAKACAAFANTYGGLLVVGVADDDDTLVGIDPVAAEAQLWVKDTLRGRVLPMPPFRARWLPTDDDRGLLLVLVEESATTPHLLTRSGTIYVRNPGSSDPVPLADQRRLLELTARGERAIVAARSNAEEALRLPLGSRLEKLLEELSFTAPPQEPTATLVLAPTGVGSDFEARLFDARSPNTLATMTWGPLAEQTTEERIAIWAQHHVGVHRSRNTPLSHRYRSIEDAVVVARTGAVAISRGYVPKDRERIGLGALEDQELRSHFKATLAAAREILSEYGGHGDLRLVYRVSFRDRGLLLTASSNLIDPTVFDDPLIVEIDTTFEDDTAEERVFAEVLRAAGIGPRAAQTP
jgi:hypothetical protein